MGSRKGSTPGRVSSGGTHESLIERHVTKDRVAMAGSSYGRRAGTLKHRNVFMTPLRYDEDIRTRDT